MSDLERALHDLKDAAMKEWPFRHGWAISFLAVIGLAFLLAGVVGLIQYHEPMQQVASVMCIFSGAGALGLARVVTR